jgi:hypothetical protein
VTFQDDQKSAALGDPEPLSARATTPKRKLVDNSPIFYDPQDTPKISPLPMDLRGPNFPGITPDTKLSSGKPDPVPDPTTLDLRTRRELMGLDLEKYGTPAVARLMQEIKQQDQQRADTVEKIRATAPVPKGRYPKQLEKRPDKGGQKWGSKCTKQKPNLDLLKCLVCEYYAAACKGYPGAFVMVPKILEHAMPRLSVRAKAVLLAILFTVRSFSLRAKNFGISFASNKEISKLSGVPVKRLYIYYKELEQENIIRKQTDSARHKTGPKKGTWKNKRNFFDISIIFKSFISIKDLEREIKHCAQYEKMQKRRAFVAENRRKSNRQID